MNKGQRLVRLSAAVRGVRVGHMLIGGVEEQVLRAGKEAAPGRGAWEGVRGAARMEDPVTSERERAENVWIQ